MPPSLNRRCLAELFGTSLLVAIGTGTIVAADSSAPWLAAAFPFAWFAAVAVPILIVGRWSGAHLNPAVTLSLVAARRFPGRDGAAYVGAQLVGAVGASVLVRALLGTAGHLGATLPRNGDLPLTFALELVATTVLVGSVLWISRPGRSPAPTDFLWPSTVVGVATYLIGPWTGSSLNPARTIGPAIVGGATLGLWVYLLAAVAASLLAAGIARWLWRPRTWSSGRAYVQPDRRPDPGVPEKD